ncbi:hypothetical protein QIT38_gp14 [Methanocaldococcus fervens tailed virus 1]|uniref:Uncharacterized protein n=3 Tax=root TaxID=1 RepID=C7P5H6_METFA|nr:hypothetical protein QIT38_gp14 [Methanocaldococcus fervens tailed virus 1]ACV25354.1 hypothetical protein Mefer_1551 [Methanocaldococcus fervens AG86]QNO11484.1 hypothetical protein [Methanocaldococcus fervens tailed virus 1]
MIMVDVSEVLAKMKPLLGMSADEDFANHEQAEASANLAIKTSQVEDADIIAILACYYYTESRDMKTDENVSVMANHFYRMYQIAIEEAKQKELNEEEGAVFFD